MDLVLIWLAFILSFWRLTIGLQHAPPLSAEVSKKSMWARGHNCTLLFALSPARERDFLFPSMTFHTASAFDILCRLDRNDTLDDVPQNKNRKVPLGCFWTNSINKTLPVLSLAVPRKSWDGSDAIVLLTSCAT